MTDQPLARSRALWNRSRLDLESDEVLAQILDRGELEAWRALYRLAREDADLRRRIKRLIGVAPIALPHFWLAALTVLGEAVDYDASLPRYTDSGGA